MKSDLRPLTAETLPMDREGETWKREAHPQHAVDSIHSWGNVYSRPRNSFSFCGDILFEQLCQKWEDLWLKWFGKWSLSGLDFWNDSMLRPGCNVHYIVLLTPRSQWDSEAKTRAGWCTDTTRLWREARGFCSTTHFWWQKNHQQFEQLWNVLWNFEFFRPRCFPAQTCAAVFNLEFDNSRRKTAVAKLAKGLVSQRWKFSKKKPAETNG